MTNTNTAIKNDTMTKAQYIQVLGGYGIKANKNWPQSALEATLNSIIAKEEAEEKAKKAESRTTSRKSTKRSPRQEFVDLAKGKVAEVMARSIINPAWELTEGANGTEKTLQPLMKKVISVLHQGGCLNTEYEKLVRKAFPKE